MTFAFNKAEFPIPDPPFTPKNIAVISLGVIGNVGIGNEYYIKTRFF